MSRVVNTVKGNLLVAFRYLLKPLVRLAMKNGLTFQDFSGVLKQAYVDGAARQMLSSGMVITEEGMSLIANIDVAEVRAIRRETVTAHSDQEAQQDSSIAKLLAVWNNNPRYSGPYGVLLDLPLHSPDQRERSLSDLVNEIAPGASLQAVLDECIRIGCVISVGNGYYRAIQRSYVPEPLSKESIGHFAHVVHNVCETCETNLRLESAGGKGLFERSIFTDTKISPLVLREFDRYVRSRGQLFADDIDNWLSTKASATDEASATLHTGVGIYHYILNDEDESDFSETQNSEGMRGN